MRRINGATAVRLVMGCAGSSAIAQDEALPAPEADVFHQALSWSPDGAWIAFSEFAGGEYSPAKWAIHVVRADGSERRRLTAQGVHISWSPDGREIAFDSTREGNQDVYVVGVDGTGERRLTTGEGREGQPSWSARGDLIAFVSAHYETRDIHVISPDGSGERRVTDDEASDFNPEWSADGSSIVFYREKGDGKDQVWVVDPESGEARRVTDGEHHNIYPSYLADGRIGYACMEGEGQTRLMTIGADGTERERVGPEPIFYARWSPDGSAIAFVSGRWPKSAIYVMDADGGNVRKIVN
jgi:Tol biopolymer transport system component